MNPQVLTRQEFLEKLTAPFELEAVEWRVGRTNAKSNGGKATKGQALAYIDARTVADRLDDVVGSENWGNSYHSLPNGVVICNLTLTYPWQNQHGSQYEQTKADGAGSTDFEPEKGSLSDAFKRSAVRFGIGRYLYGLDSPWVDLTDKGQIEDKDRKKLDELYLRKITELGWGGRQNVVAYKLLSHALKTLLTQPSDVETFRSATKGMVSTLPVDMRRHLEEQLARVGASREYEAVQSTEDA